MSHQDIVFTFDNTISNVLKDFLNGQKLYVIRHFLKIFTYSQDVLINLDEINMQ